MTTTRDPVERSLRASDAFSWYLERDPLLRIPVVVVVHLGGEPDLTALRGRLAASLDRVPELSQVVVVPPLRLAPPRWSRAAHVDLDWHVREISAPPPGDRAVLLSLARQEATTPFDPERPLWSVTVVRGLEGGGAALVLRFHHALTDGVGGVALAGELFDLVPGPGPSHAAPRDTQEPSAHPVLRALAEESTGLLRHSLTAPFDLTRQGLHALAHPRASLETLASVARTVAPVRHALSPLMQERGLTRSLHALDVPLDALHATASARGCTVNDALLTAVSHGLGSYHALNNVPLPQVRVTMPVDLRAPDDPPGGNRITLLRFVLPTGHDGVESALRAVHEVAQERRHERSLPHTQAIARTLSLLPSGVVGSMLKRVEAVVSDVPGPPVPLFAAGAPVVGWHVFGPTTGAALNVTLLSYEGTCHLGLNIDSRAVREPEQLAACIGASFEELLALDA